MNEIETPLELMIESVMTELRRQNYGENTIRRYSQHFKRILVTAREEGIKRFNKALKDQYLLKQYNYPKETHGDIKSGMRAIKMLEFYAEHGYITKRIQLPDFEYPEQYSGELDKYREYLLKRNLSVGTVDLHLFGLQGFVRYLIPLGVESLAEIEPRHITGYIPSLTILSKETVRSRMYSLKSFLRYAAESGTHPISLEKHVPKLTCPRGEHLAATWTADETEKIIASTDRGSPTGKRDYAILLLAARLGIRTSDIVALRLEDIKWERNSIEFSQVKTKANIHLPLSSEVGTAIIDYLRYGRPKSTCPNVFIRHVSPYAPLTSIYAIVDKHIRLSGVERKGQKHGAHTFRHSLVSRLLEQSTPYPVVSGILGQIDPNSAKAYTHVDIEQLRGCSLYPEQVVKYA